MKKSYRLLCLAHLAALVLIGNIVLEARDHRAKAQEAYALAVPDSTFTTNLYGPWSDKLALGTSGYIERRCTQFPSTRGNESPFFCIWDMAHI